MKTVSNGTEIKEPTVSVCLDNAEQFLREANQVADEILSVVNGSNLADLKSEQPKAGIENSASRLSSSAAGLVGLLKTIQNKL